MTGRARLAQRLQDRADDLGFGLFDVRNERAVARAVREDAHDVDARARRVLQRVLAEQRHRRLAGERQEPGRCCPRAASDAGEQVRGARPEVVMHTPSLPVSRA